MGSKQNWHKRLFSHLPHSSEKVRSYNTSVSFSFSFFFLLEFPFISLYYFTSQALQTYWRSLKAKCTVYLSTCVSRSGLFFEGIQRMNTSAVLSSSSIFICSEVIPRVPAQIRASFIPVIARLSVLGCFLVDRTGLCKPLPGIFCYLLSWGARRQRP